MGNRKGSNLTDVKKQNVSAIRDVIYRHGPISRSEIARMLSLTPPTITTNIARMMEQGLVHECGILEPETKEVGRRRVKIDFVEDAAFFVGIEVNPYQIAICITNLRGVMTAEARIPWKRREDNFVLSEDLKELLRRIDGNDYRGSVEMLAGVILTMIEVSGIERERAIVKTVIAELKKGRESMISELCPDLEFLGTREILMAQECGDELAEEVISQALLYLGATLANIINLMNPSLVFVDSYLMKLKKNRRRLVEDTRAHIFGLYNDEVEFEFVEFGHFTGAKGAAAVAIERYFINE